MGNAVSATPFATIIPGVCCARDRSADGQGNVRQWVPDLLPLPVDGDPLGVDDFATHRLPLEAAPAAYEQFQKKQDGMVKVRLQPGPAA